MKTKIVSYKQNGKSRYYNVVLKNTTTGKTYPAFMSKCALDLHILKGNILSTTEVTEENLDDLIELAKMEQIQDSETYL